jgi:peroxiredoxin
MDLALLVAWLGDLTTAQGVGLAAGIVGLGLLAAGGWLLVHLLGQNGRLLLRLDALEAALAARGVPPGSPPEPGLPVGAPAPGFSLPGLYGETLTLDALRAADKPVLLVFSNPGCGPCNSLLPELGRWQREHAARLTIALIGEGAPEANRAKAAEHGLGRVLLQKGREVATAYEADGTPMAVVVRPDGTIGSPLASGGDVVRALVAKTVGAPASAAPPAPFVPGPAAGPAGCANGSGANGAVAPPTQAGVAAVGAPAPAFTLPDLEGRPVSLADFRGASTVVLFWNPGCGFCVRMLDDLKAWEANPPAGAPKLLVVSLGTVETNREQDFRSPVVLDQSFATGRAFGTGGTPTAVLVDAEGRIASAIGDGAPGVLALLNGQALPPAPAAANEAAAPVPFKVGERAPEVKLQDLAGKTVSLATYRGTKLMVLFWNPGCGFCTRMLDDLKAWEANPPKGAPKLLVVSTGDLEANRAMGLRSPVLLDRGFAVGSAFGATGTPSAVLIDARGNIASEVSVGGDAVLALARARPYRAKAVPV